MSQFNDVVCLFIVEYKTFCRSFQPSLTIFVTLTYVCDTNFNLTIYMSKLYDVSLWQILNSLPEILINDVCSTINDVCWYVYKTV